MDTFTSRSGWFAVTDGMWTLTYTHNLHIQTHTWPSRPEINGQGACQKRFERWWDTLITLLRINCQHFEPIYRGPCVETVGTTMNTFRLNCLTDLYVGFLFICCLSFDVVCTVVVRLFYFLFCRFTAISLRVIWVSAEHGSTTNRVFFPFSFNWQLDRAKSKDECKLLATNGFSAGNWAHRIEMSGNLFFFFISNYLCADNRNE